MSIHVPKTWEFVHSAVCKYFANNNIKYMFNKLEPTRETTYPYALYSVNDEAIFTIMVYREAVFYDNEFDIILHFNGSGGDRALMAQWFHELENILLEKPRPVNIACQPGECNFDDLM